MALTRVQTTAKVTGSGATVAIPFTTPPTLGNAIIVPVVGQDVSVSFPAAACSDNYGNIYQLAATIVQPSGFDAAAAIYYCEAVGATGSGFTVTVTATLGTAVEPTGCAIEVSGGFGLLLDQTKTAIGTSTTPATGATAALTAAEEFVVAVQVGGSALASITVEAVSPVWTEAFEQLSLTGATVGEADSRILTGATGTTTSCSWTLASSIAWAAVLATFKPVLVLPAGRVTQDTVELLSLPVLPAARVTQDTVETLSLPVAAARATQAAIELLSSSAVAAPTESRTTQLLAEVVSFPVADGRLTQLLAEVVSASGPPPTESRVTQLLAEVVSPSPAIPARVTALSVDVFREVTLPSAVTQLAAEVSLRQVVPARETQQAVEVFETVPAEARHTHEALEVHRGGTAKARVTQLVVEVFLIPPPCVPGPFPVDDVPAGGSCPARLLS